MADEMPGAGTPGRPRVGLLVLAVAVFAAVTTEMLPIGLLPAIGADLGVPESRVGLLVGLYAAMVAVLSVPLTVATRRVPRKRLLLVATGCYTLSNLLSALAPGFALLAVGRVVGGATHALFFAVCIGYATRLVPPERTGRALALVSAGVSVGFVLGIPLATALGTAAGWRTAFAALTVLMLVVVALIAVVLPDVPTSPPSVRAAPGRRRRLALVVTSNAVAFVGHFALYTYVSALLLRSGAVERAVAPLLLVLGAAGLVGVLVGGPWLDRSPRRSGLVVLGLVVAGVAGVAVGYPHLVWVVAAGALWIGAWGPVPSLYQAAAVRAGAGSPELAGAWINATANVGIVLGAVLGGQALEAGGILAAAALALGLLLVATAVLAVRGVLPGAGGASTVPPPADPPVDPSAERAERAAC